ncbi:hypothetical protein Q4Q49_06570 [Shewanella sp. SP1S1-7]|uniref:hypothetical protein n=1 Tax=Shewanella sp. SP1S1-7 TaxID=3063536 RepID=UPI002890D020|nr:hypothetical protein [Shewanella sp. SP1S1-7]MDT3334960.1 hypothetical protein [Shewanella sp. SP1S1-7]
MKVIAIVLMLLTSNLCVADVSWTDNNYKGKGVGVVNVYPQWDKHWITFQGTDGKMYFYYWGNSEEPNERAKMFLSMLLTAFSADYKVSVAAETTSQNGWYAFTFLNLHK